MNKIQREIDEIDLELFRLMNKAERLSERLRGSKVEDLAQAIRVARSISHSLLPDSRKKELSS